MHPLPIDPRIVEECRSLAGQVADQVQSFISAHTTVSIERTVLRAYGVDGVDGEGVPLVNRCVDRYRGSAALGHGIAALLGLLLVRRPGLPIQEAAEELAFGHTLPEGADLLSALDAERAAIEAVLVEPTRLAIEKIDVAHSARIAAWKRLGLGPDRAPATGNVIRPGGGPPLKYVIVATGNIYDDADQARAAAQVGADVIAVIRSTAQSLIDYVPYGATTEGYGGTWATQENFRIVRRALDEEQEKLGRYLQQVNYSSGLCMPEIAYLGAVERLDMLLNDAMYGILFRDINPKRTLCDQYFSRRIIGRAGIIINTGEDNYLTTADAVEKAHTVLASQFINEAFAFRAGLCEEQMGLGHAFEIDKALPDSFVLELAQALLVRQLFPKHPIKWMPATKHKTGDIFFSHRVDGLFDLLGVMTGQTIELLGMMTEAIHTPLLHDRWAAIKGADYVFTAARSLGKELRFDPEGQVVARAKQVLDEAVTLLRKVAQEGLFAAIAAGEFADVRRPENGGRGLDGVIARHPGYTNPILRILEGHNPTG
ncbi:MAG TPA: lysine 5,6-aminomutase subunit alpha [Pseudomonadota bacterium]|nr:lysine 5,6-aminomutase subunit alpha [Pseudomonadota bacterium]HNO68438.1 lysine 5,6-aminomutase subunit alpha [Pseudomonadota bacterium]